MTLYLLDENVLRELRREGNARVRAWYATVPDGDLRLSVMTLFEKRRGWERRRRTDPELAVARLADLAAMEAAYEGRIVPIDAPVAAEWARLLGAKDKNRADRALAATARVHGFVLATRNIGDVQGCGVRVLDPFVAGPAVQVV